MTRFVVLWSVCLALTLPAALHAQDGPQLPGPAAEHQWLKQFVGEWESESEAVIEPGQPPLQCKGTMSSRMLGELWLVAEVTGEMAGTTVTAVQTIGYDPAKKQYVGTWVDSMMNHMWQYKGTGDESGKTITLEAEGPNYMANGKIARFRDAYEFKSKDHILATSSMMNDDGQWVTFMTGHFRRKK